MDIVQFFKESEKYIVLFDVFAQKHSLIGRASADHICYKCGSHESFENIRRMFETQSEYIYQSIISNRPIAYIRFKTAMDTVIGPINYLELSDQKPDMSQKEGFDHIEVFPTAVSYQEMVGELQQTETVVHVERPHHTTDDVDISEGFLFRCTQGPLIQKIKESEMC